MHLQQRIGNQAVQRMLLFRGQPAIVQRKEKDPLDYKPFEQPAEHPVTGQRWDPRSGKAYTAGDIGAKVLLEDPNAITPETLLEETETQIASLAVLREMALRKKSSEAQATVGDIDIWLARAQQLKREIKDRTQSWEKEDAAFRTEQAKQVRSVVESEQIEMLSTIGNWVSVAVLGNVLTIRVRLQLAGTFSRSTEDYKKDIEAAWQGRFRAGFLVGYDVKVIADISSRKTDEAPNDRAIQVRMTENCDLWPEDARKYCKEGYAYTPVREQNIWMPPIAVNRPDILVHELGHVFGAIDEYTYNEAKRTCTNNYPENYIMGCSSKGRFIPRPSETTLEILAATLTLSGEAMDRYADLRTSTRSTSLVPLWAGVAALAIETNRIDKKIVGL